MNKQRYLLIFISILGTSILAYMLFTFFKPTQSSDTIKVGILHSLTGTMAANENNLVDATLFAIEQINQAGGILGKDDSTYRCRWQIRSNSFCPGS